MYIFFMIYSLLADLVLLIHAAYLSFVVLGEILILVGHFMKWRWIHNPVFRIGHLGAIGIVVIEVFIGYLCPLTKWEYDLRILAGQSFQEGTLLKRVLHRVMFFNFPDWVFLISYVAFGALVLATLFLVPIHNKRKSED